MRGDTVTVPRWVAEEIAARYDPRDEAVVAMAEAAGESLPWSMLRPLISDLEHEDRDRAFFVQAQVDQLQAYATARLGELDVDLRDHRVLYEAVCVLALVHECAVNGAENGALNDDEASAIRALARALGAALGRLAPDEARS